MGRLVTRTMPVPNTPKNIAKDILFAPPKTKGEWKDLAQRMPDSPTP